MPSSTRGIVAATTAVCVSGLLAFALLPSQAPTRKPAVRPVPTENVIVVPGPDQVLSTVDLSRCPWMQRYLCALAPTSDPGPLAPLLIAPLVAAEYGGMPGESAQR